MSRAVGKDFTDSAAVKGAVNCLIKPLHTASIFENMDPQHYPLNQGSKAKELFLSVHEVYHVTQDRLHSLERNIQYDHRFEGVGTSFLSRLAIYESRFIVPHTFDKKTGGFDSLFLYPPNRGEQTRNMRSEARSVNQSATSQG